MRILKIICLNLITLGSALSSIAQVVDNHVNFEHQLLWQISGKGLKKPSYLFGSYHSNDPRVFKLSDSTYAVLNQVDGFVLEANVYELFTKYDMRISETPIQFDANGKAYTSSKKATKTRYGSEDGRPQFLDLYFQQLAYNMDKSFYVLETIEEQIEAFMSVYDRNFTLKNLEDYQVVQNNLLQSYLRGDIDQVLRIMKRQMSTSSTAFDQIIVQRNYTMVEGIDTLCPKKSLFIAVGAGHLAGPEGLIQLLRKKGYNVTQVLASFADKKTSHEIALKPYNSFKYHDTCYNFNAVFGGKPIRDSSSTYRLVYQEMGQGNTYIIEVEDQYDKEFSTYVNDIIDPPENSRVIELVHPGNIDAYEGVGYEYGGGYSWKRVFVYNDKIIKLICYGGNKFMNSNRPQAFFNQVRFSE